MHFLDLNHDVLIYLAHFLTRKDISRLTKLCHEFHRIYAPVVLKGLVWLTRGNLPSFCSFVGLEDERHGGPRIDLLRSLQTLRFNVFPSAYFYPVSSNESVRLFTTILSHAHNITTLGIYCVSMAFTLEQLRIALSAPLPQLRELIIDGVTSDYADVLAGAPASIRVVNLTMTKYHGDPGLDNEVFAHADPLPFLRYHRPALTALTLCEVVLGTQGEPFPNVRRLEIPSFATEADWMGWAPPLIHLFPNAEHVDLWSLQAQDDSAPTRNLDTRDPTALLIARGWRSRSRLWQEEHGTWSNGLRLLCVRSVMDLYCLGLSCPVDRLHVLEATSSIEVSRAALGDVHPRRVWIPIASSSELVRNTGTLLEAVAQTPSVTHLMLDLGEGFIQYSGSPQLSLTTLANKLHGSNMSHLCFYLCEDQFGERDRIFGTPPSGGSESSSKSAMDIPEVVKLIGDRNSALRQVFVFYDAYDMRAWERRRTTQGTSTHWSEIEGRRARQLAFAERVERYES
ncbi:hypothetical protein C8Q77DRAFT_1119489 [Trametes polyzona]|nr:hypothetical protein C8Q77DRAFT_1119489 [Trametes polyzona]